MINTTQNPSKNKILVADDDPAIVDALQFMLEEEGYEVATTVDADAVTKFVVDKPDLVLLDIWMSGQDGREICKYLKTQESTKQIPIIMISANKDTEKIAKESGANDFIAKPFEMDELLGKIRENLTHYS